MTLTSVENPDQLNLENCSREPIYIKGKTRAHRVLVVFDPQNLKITQMGENVTRFFSVAFDDLFGNDFSYLLGEKLVKDLEEVQISKKPSVSQDVRINNTNFHDSGLLPRCFLVIL